MAITGYYGPPGAGKSYAVVSQVLYPAYCAGRRVVTNIDGINPEAFKRLALEDGKEEHELGEVVTFDGNDANSDPDFWPHQDKSDESTFIKGGDLIAFDEWRLYWPKRGKLPRPEAESFLRWHRHLTNEDGVTCDVAIATQVPADVHMDFRALIEKSYKFKKLNAVGFNKGYSWWVWDGHLVPKGEFFSNGTHRYKKRMFELYSSYDSGKAGAELSTDKRSTIWSPMLIGIIIAVPLVMAFAAWNFYQFFQGSPDEELTASTIGEPQSIATPQQTAIAPSSTRYRIVGTFGDPLAPVVVVEGPNGFSQHAASDFVFDRGRPVRGVIFGEVVNADDWKFPSETGGNRPSSATGSSPPSIGAAIAGN